MNKRFIQSTIAAGILILAAPLATQAAPPEGDGCQPPMMEKQPRIDSGELPRHLQNLNLSAEQRTKIVELLKTQEPALQDKAKAGWNAHNDLRNLALSADYTPDKAKALSETSVRIMTEGALLHAGLDNAIYLLLTPEQQQQFKQQPLPDHKHRGSGIIKLK
jgi:periplasmic protein CpxP/Spy